MTRAGLAWLPFPQSHIPRVASPLDGAGLGLKTHVRVGTLDLRGAKLCGDRTSAVGGSQ